MRCGTFWWWRHERRWVPKAIGKADLAAWFGRAIDRGVKARYWGQDLEDATIAACIEFSMACEEARAWERDEPTEEATKPLIRLIHATLNAYQFEPWEIVSIDQRIGHAILDLVIQEPTGRAVVDIKTVMKKPREEYWVRRLQEWRKSWQLADYRDRLLEHMKAGWGAWWPTPRGVPVNAYVHVIVAEPFEVVTHPITPDPGWAQDQRIILGLMEWSRAGAVDGLPVWRNRSRCHDWFGGDCPYLRACWDYEGQEERFTVDYVQRPAQRPVEGPPLIQADVLGGADPGIPGSPVGQDSPLSDSPPSTTEGCKTPPAGQGV